MDEEQRLGGAAERLSASAFLARYRSFRYIETRSETKMTDTSHSPLATHHSPVLTGTAPQTEIDVTCSKQTTKKFLTGARTDIRQTRICAKMNAQISPKLTAQMSQTR